MLVENERGADTIGHRVREMGAPALILTAFGVGYVKLGGKSVNSTRFCCTPAT